MTPRSLFVGFVRRLREKRRRNDLLLPRLTGSMTLIRLGKDVFSMVAKLDCREAAGFPGSPRLRLGRIQQRAGPSSVLERTENSRPSAF
jgi:hypothetical protein